jgi:hypothetical protein
MAEKREEEPRALFRFSLNFKSYLARNNFLCPRNFVLPLGLKSKEAHNKEHQRGLIMRKILYFLPFLSLAVLVIFATSPSSADDQSKPTTSTKPPKSYGKNLEKVDVIPPEWKTISARKLTSAEVDAALQQLQVKEGIKPAPLTSDEQFVRRVYLDLTGKLPDPAVIKAFVADKSSDKRAHLIDKLLGSDDFNTRWSRYWRDVVTVRATDQRSRVNEPIFEAWLVSEMKKNQPWSKMVSEMLTSTGELRFRGEESKENKDSGAGYFLLTHTGAEADNERAADTARVFMGIQIQCAQCHDHPSDIWKRDQFHELASFFARTKDRPIREENKLVGIKLFGAMVGEHRMPDKDDPKKTHVMEVKFLTGEKPKRGLDDDERRSLLAQYVTAPENYWFFANFVNRTWAELMGQSFYNPVDNMGPLQEATYPELLIKLAAHFKATECNIRDFYRLIMNSQAYQRQLRLGESADQHAHFAGNYPSKLTADELWNSVTAALGGLTPPIMQRPPPGKAATPADRLARRFGFEGQFKQMFAFDPTTKPDEVEASIPQALMLMNSPVIQNKLRATGENALAKILSTHTNNAEAVQALYLRVLARNPTTREQQTSLDYIKRIGKRNEAFEDVFWALLNSAEFQTKR